MKNLLLPSSLAAGLLCLWLSGWMLVPGWHSAQTTACLLLFGLAALAAIVHVWRLSRAEPRREPWQIFAHFFLLGLWTFAVLLASLVGLGESQHGGLMVRSKTLVDSQVFEAEALAVHLYQYSELPDGFLWEAVAVQRLPWPFLEEVAWLDSPTDSLRLRWQGDSLWLSAPGHDRFLAGRGP